MTPKTKLIRTVYLYLAALISLIFVAVGSGRIINSGIKYVFFPEAEKKSYYDCNIQPPMSGYMETKETERLKNSTVATEDQKEQIDSLLKDYAYWKENQSGEKCLAPVRQNNFIDAFTMIFIALPILLIHWVIIKREKTEKE
jgi:hypothetical protein